MPATLHGWFRHTDIQFEWGAVLESLAEEKAVKAFLSPNSLCDIDNPLRDPTKEGIGLFQGASTQPM